MTDTADHPEHDGTEAIETSRTVESERVQTRRRFVLGATATLGTGLLAGCSAGRTGGGSTDTAVDTDTPTRTPTPTDEPVEYPRRISDEEIQSMSLTDIYEMAEETEFIHPNNEKILEEVDYEQIEAENDRRVDQLKEVMKETAMETHNTSRNGFVGMLGVFGLSWVDNQGENMLVDEVTLSFGGRTPGIEMIYEDENGEKQISIYDPRGFDVEEEWAIEGMIEKNFYEDAPGSELNNNEIPGYALIDLEAVKETSKLASKDPQQFDSHGGYDQWIHSFENNLPC